MAGKRSQSTPRHPRSPLARQQRVHGHVKTIGPAVPRVPVPGSRSRTGGGVAGVPEIGGGGKK